MAEVESSLFTGIVSPYARAQSRLCLRRQIRFRRARAIVTPIRLLLYMSAGCSHCSLYQIPRDVPRRSDPETVSTAIRTREEGANSPRSRYSSKLRSFLISETVGMWIPWPMMGSHWHDSIIMGLGSHWDPMQLPWDSGLPVPGFWVLVSLLFIYTQGLLHRLES